MKCQTTNVALYDEEGRLAALDALEARSRVSEASFDHITRLACISLGIDKAAITLIDADTQYLAAKQGIPISYCDRNSAICHYTIQDYKPLVIEDLRRDVRFTSNPAVIGPPYFRCYAGVPLTTRKGHNLGALCVLGTEPRSFTATQITILTELADLVMDQLTLRSQASTDYLTGARTRRHFMQSLDDELARRDCNATIVLLDIDHFKSVNDEHGHPVGDKVLAEFTSLLLDKSRAQDVVGRLGGEEFAILLPNTNSVEASFWAERVREAVESASFAGEKGLSITVSIGFAHAGKGSTKQSERLIAAADAALYRAKQAGRNRIIAA